MHGTRIPGHAEVGAAVRCGDSGAGGSSLHTCMAPHGPDQKTFEAAVGEEKASKPQTITETLAFMFEVSSIPHVTQHAMGLPSRSVLAYLLP